MKVDDRRGVEDLRVEVAEDALQVDHEVLSLPVALFEAEPVELFDAQTASRRECLLTSPIRHLVGLQVESSRAAAVGYEADPDPVARAPVQNEGPAASIHLVVGMGGDHQGTLAARGL